MLIFSNKKNFSLVAKEVVYTRQPSLSSATSKSREFDVWFSNHRNISSEKLEN